MTVGSTAADPTLDRTESWFLANGLSYFVPEERAAARRDLRSRRTVVVLTLVVIVTGAVGVLLARLVDQTSAAPAVVLSVGLAIGGTYALYVLRARGIVWWALARSLRSLRTVLPMMTRALPLLLVFVTFLFINAEVWQLSASLDPGTLWLVVLLFAGLAVAFLLVRLPEEVDTIDDEVDADFLRRTTRRTPLEEQGRALASDADMDLAAYATVTGFERWNLVLVLLVIQLVQLLLLAAGVFGFFLLFGSLTMEAETQRAWTGISGELGSVPGLSNISVPLVKVSFFLSAFSLLYLTVSTVTDETYREQFFGSVMRELERAVGVRTVYLALRDRGQV